MERQKTLSDRERQLLDLAGTGHTDTQIAQELGISEATVATYWGRVRIKFGPLNRTELVANYIRDQTMTLIEELREKNRQLIEELQKRDDNQGDGSEADYHRRLIEKAPDAILIMLADGMIESANLAACDLFGYETGTLEGKSINTLIPDRYHTTHAGHREDYVKSADRRRMGDHISTVGLHRLGRELQIAATLAPVESATGLRVMCVVRPV